MDLKRRVDEGEVADLVIIRAEDIDSMITSGTLVDGGRLDLAKSIIGVAVRPGLPKPDVSSGEKLKGALLAANAIIISSGPSSRSLREGGYPACASTEDEATRAWPVGRRGAGAERRGYRLHAGK